MNNAHTPASSSCSLWDVARFIKTGVSPAKMESNHEFCRDTVLALFPSRAGESTELLDYGCCDGQVVYALQGTGADAYGAGVFDASERQ